MMLAINCGYEKIWKVCISHIVRVGMSTYIKLCCLLRLCKLIAQVDG